MKHTKKIKINKNYLISIGAVVIVLILTVIGVHVLYTTHAATGDAYFTLAPSSGSYTVGNNLVLSVSVTSTSGDNTNAAQVNLSYPSSLLHYQGISLNGPFTLCGQEVGGNGSVNIGCASTTVASGTQPFAQITFSVLASGSAPIAMTAGSDIDNTSGTSVWNGSLPSASYTLSPVVTSTPTTTPTTTPTSSSSSSSSTKSSGATSSPSSTKSTTPTSTATTPSTTTNTTAPSLASITVTIVSAQGKPIFGAKVSLDKQPPILTNVNGLASFSAVASGTHTIIVSEPGKKSTQTQLLLAPGENKVLSLKLTNGNFGRNYTDLIVIGIILFIILVIGNICFRVFRRKLTTTPPSNVQGSDFINTNLPNDIAVAPTPTITLPQQTNITATPPQANGISDAQTVSTESLIPVTPPEIISPQPPIPTTSSDQDEIIIHPTEPHNS